MTEPAMPAGGESLDHALALAACGLRVMPIKPGKKAPPMRSWQHAATTDPNVVTNWYRGFYRNHGVGVATGLQPDGRRVFALDVDEHDPTQSGSATLAELVEQYGPLPATVQSVTGPGGMHLLFESGEVDVTNGSELARMPGLDVRGQGGQIVVAPTVHPNGTPYRWVEGRAPWEHAIAPAPEWLLGLAGPAEPEPWVGPVGGDLNTPTTFLQSVGDSPADDLRLQWDWPSELVRRGWVQKGNSEYWVRPGKDPREDGSAVLHGDGPLVVFSTDGSMADLWRAGVPTKDGSGVSVSPLAFLAAYEYHGSLSDATKGLREATGATPAAPLDAFDPMVGDPTLKAMLIDWAEFWSKEHGEAAWLCEPLIAAKRSHALFAPGGSQKSLLVLWLCACLATGRPIFGTHNPPIDVLYLDFEMTPDDVAERLEAMGFGPETDLSRFHYALLPSLPGLDTKDGGQTLIALAEMVDAQLVVIDTFGRAVHGDENDANTLLAWYRWSGILLKAAGRAFLRIDHAGKNLEKGQRGTSGKNDDVDVVWQLAKVEGGLKLTTRKKRMSWIPETVSLVGPIDEPELHYTMATGHGYLAGVGELAKEFDALGIPPGASARQAAKLYRESGGTARTELIRSTQKYRSSEVRPFVPAEPAPGPDPGDELI
jgi:hypothetical protein